MMTQFALKITAVLLMLGGLSACQMMSARPYDGVLGYTVQQQNGQKIDFRYIDEDRHDWPSMIKRSEKLCAKLQNRPPQSVQLEGVQQQIIQKNFSLVNNLRVPTATTGDASQPGVTILRTSTASVFITEQKQSTFKQLDATCTLR